MKRTPLAERLLEEAVRMEEHPGIVFRDGAAGRSACLLGHRLRVWEVALRANRLSGDLNQVAQVLPVPVALLQAAMDYYRDHRDEIDAEIREAEELVSARGPSGGRAGE